MNARFKNMVDVLRLAGVGLVIDLIMIGWSFSVAIGAYQIYQINPIVGKLLIDFGWQLVALTIMVMGRHIVYKLVA